MSTAPVTRRCSFFNTDDTKLSNNASEPVNDRARWLDQFVHLMGHTGNYTREEAIAEIDREGTLPDMLSFNPSEPATTPTAGWFHRRRHRLPARILLRRDSADGARAAH